MSRAGGPYWQWTLSHSRRTANGDLPNTERETQSLAEKRQRTLSFVYKLLKYSAHGQVWGINRKGRRSVNEKINKLCGADQSLFGLLENCGHERRPGDVFVFSHWLWQTAVEEHLLQMEQTGGKSLSFLIIVEDQELWTAGWNSKNRNLFLQWTHTVLGNLMMKILSSQRDWQWNPARVVPGVVTALRRR